MKKMKPKTKNTIVTLAVAGVMLAGGVTLGANKDNILEFAADKLGYEKVIEDEKLDETPGDETPGAEDSGVDDSTEPTVE